MLGDYNVFAMVPVKDLEVAKKFYGETLGLKKLDENQGGIMYGSGNGRIIVYPTENAGTAKTTIVTWEVDDISVVVSELKSKDISFEHYDWPGVVYEGDVHVMGEMKAAWFKDPDGNILGLGQD
jgi:extradiol dioxygenase family protein